MNIDNLIEMLTNIKNEKGNIRVTIGKLGSTNNKSTEIKNIKQVEIYPNDREDIVILETY